MVHLNTFGPGFKLLTPEFGLVELVKLPFPETTVQRPVSPAKF